ncbi:MAG: glycosyltransferase family 4 protein [bacterium]|nr:glycosyltransferase family 4 protein [bacterium]
MNKLRILQIVTRLAVRGVPRHVLDIAAGLDPERYEVEVIAGRSEPNEGSLWEEAEARGIVTHRIESLQRSVHPGDDVKTWIALYRKIKHGRYDIVHTHIAKAGFLGRLAARWAGIPIILHTYHGEIEELRGHSIQSRIFTTCEALASRVSNALVSVSQNTAQTLITKGIGSPNKYTVIPNGIDLKNYQLDQIPKIDIKGTPRLGVIASLTVEKGIDILLQSLPPLLENHPDLRLYILGDGPLRESLNHQTQQLNIQNHVHFSGNVEDVRPWIAAFDLVVLPSRHEAMGRSLLEAMAMGRPVIASRTGGIPELVRHNETGILVPPEDPKALAQAIDDLFQNDQKRLTLAQSGKADVEHRFSLETMIDRLDRLYQDLYSKQHHSKSHRQL